MPPQKRKKELEASYVRIKKLIRKEPEITDRQIFLRTGVGYRKVGELRKEVELRSQNEELKARSVKLDTEKIERTADVKEATDVMVETSDLKEEYPKLIEQNDEEVFDLEAMRRAVILIDTTRDGIMGGVKKRIESHMVHFLPALTDDRYSMVRIDEKEYRIEIYDREAKRWRGKGVFSGATQDQFSLALRLAFALSTIP